MIEAFRWRAVRPVVWTDIYMDGTYHERNPLWHLEESPWKAKLILRMLDQSQLAPTSMCDVGCGAGEVLRLLQENLGRDCVFWGYDVSPQAYALCQPRANERLRFKLGDIRQEDCHFDVVLLLDVIEHLEDYFSFLRAVKSKGQYKILHIPLDVSVQTVFRRYGLLKRRDLHAHLHYFTKDTALRTLEDLGYEVLDYFYTPRSIELGTGLTQKLVNFPRRLLFAVHQDLAVRLLGGYSLLVLAK
jgi:SAM-dependent methyltransferase